MSKLSWGTILLINVLSASASFSLFVIVLLLSFNIMHSLWKALSEKKGLTVFENFLLSVTILLLKFPRLCFFHVSIYFKFFDLVIMGFLEFFSYEIICLYDELFARTKFFFLFEAYLSIIDRKISVNSDRSASFKSIFNNLLFNSLWNTWLSKFL